MSKLERQLLVWLFPYAISYHGYVPVLSRIKKSASTRVHLLHGIAEHAATAVTHKDITSFEMFRVASAMLPALVSS